MAAKSSPKPLVLVCGEDDFAVRQRAGEIFKQWSEELGGMDHETIDGQVSNVSEALTCLGRVREALQTLPFFGGGKAIWLRGASFLGDDRTAASANVNDSVGSLAKELKDFDFSNVRFVISAGKVDKRKAFYKTINSLGSVETFAGLSINDRDWETKASDLAAQMFRELGKKLSYEALAQFVNYVGPDARALRSEAEKLALYTGDQDEVTAEAVDTITTRNKHARAFALGEALGDRNLKELLRILDEEIWEMKMDPKKTEIGLLYGLISKVRVMLGVKEAMREGWVREERNFSAFKGALASIPPGRLPAVARANPLSANPYVVFRASQQCRNYSSEELVRGMEGLLECNRRLVQTQTDAAMLIQQALTGIVARKKS